MSTHQIMQRAAPQKAVIEYPLPGTRQTHEVAAIGENLLVVSQQDCSGLLKVQLHPRSGRPVAVRRFQMGAKYSGFHGLCASKKHPGWLWGTLQFESAILLIDPHGAELSKPPEVISNYHLPSEAWGPHVVLEHGDDVWTTCKGSGHLVKVNTSVPDDQFTVYKCDGRPIFVAVHPTSKDVYASLDIDSKIFRLTNCGKVSHIDIPPAKGSTPVGLVAGSDGNVWFVLLGTKSGGSGTFGCISDTGDITWFKLPVFPLNNSIGLIHLAFDPSFNSGSNTQLTNGSSITNGHDKEVLKIWLLGSTLISEHSIDAIFTVSIEAGRIVRQDTVSLATQPCFTHRVLPHRTGVFVTELGVSTLAYAAGDGIGLGHKLTLRKGYETPSETSDAYALWGLGRYGDFLSYVHHDGLLHESSYDPEEDRPLSKKRTITELMDF